MINDSKMSIIGKVDKNLSSFEYKGRTIYYEVFSDCTEYGTWHWTKFYKTNNRWRKKQTFFGFGKPKLVPCNEEYPFTLPVDITDCHRTKEENRKYLDRQFKLIGRCEEIKKGEIV